MMMKLFNIKTILPALFSGVVLSISAITGAQASVVTTATLAAANTECGGLAQVPCDDIDIRATRRGAAASMGCPGRQLYFTPRNGGECWKCPTGYRRTTTPVYKANSCEKRGISFKRTSAKFVRTAYGCPANQFHQGDSCYSCPSGYEKKPFSTSPKCKPVETGCKAGYVKGPVPFRGLARDYGLSRDRYCTNILRAATLAKQFSSPIDQMEAHINTATSLPVFLKEMTGPDGKRFTAAMDRKDYIAAFNVLKSMDSFVELAHAMSGNVKTITVSASSGGAFIAGADVSGGLAIDPVRLRAKAFASDTRAVGAEISGGTSFAVGFWQVEVPELAGASQGVTAGVPFDVGIGVGGTQWYSFIGNNKPEEYLGKEVFVDVGLGIGTGQYLQSHTTVY